MGDAIRFNSKSGPVVYVCMASILALFVILSLLLPSSHILIPLCITLVLESYLIALPRLTVYSFDDECLTVRVPFQFDEPPAAYRNIWKVVDSHDAKITLHGLSPDAILIWYDKGTGHHLCISPRDKEAVMSILRERCHDAVFETP